MVDCTCPAQGIATEDYWAQVDSVLALSCGVPLGTMAGSPWCLLTLHTGDLLAVPDKSTKRVIP